jgi:hypothetical protein
MKLIDIYIQEVIRRLPEKNREDIALELRSTIEDMLPDDYSEKDVKEVLSKLGNPAALASGYRDQPMHLIGPRYFDVYVSLLKMILPIATVIALISTIATYLIGTNGDEAVLMVIINIFAKSIWIIIEVAMQVFFWFTLTFAIIERADKDKTMNPLTPNFKAWTPDDLKNIGFIPKKRVISKGEVFFHLFWTAIWATVYFYADHLLGVYQNNGDGLQFIMPSLNQDVLQSFWPFVLLVVGLELILALYKLIKGQWTKQLAIYNTLYELAATVILIVIIMNPNLFQQEFLTYMSGLFKIEAAQFQFWMTSGVIILFVVSAVINVFDGFRKYRIHK